MLPIPATFVVGTEAIIKARHVDPDYRRRMEVDELLAALKRAASASMRPVGRAEQVEQRRGGGRAAASGDAIERDIRA